jgi:uncharacterized membrane protein YeaQ/YmgE (transglycosylase-associated protein family)
MDKACLIKMILCPTQQAVKPTFPGQMIGWYKRGQSADFIMSVLGAVLILWIYRLFKGKATA